MIIACFYAELQVNEKSGDFPFSVGRLRFAVNVTDGSVHLNRFPEAAFR